MNLKVNGNLSSLVEFAHNGSPTCSTVIRN